MDHIIGCYFHQRLSFSCINPSRFNPGRREKITLDIHFRTSLWCLKRIYEGFAFIKLVEAPQRSVKIKI